MLKRHPLADGRPLAWLASLLLVMAATVGSNAVFAAETVAHAPGRYVEVNGAKLWVE